MREGTVEVSAFPVIARFENLDQAVGESRIRKAIFEEAIQVWDESNVVHPVGQVFAIRMPQILQPRVALALKRTREGNHTPGTQSRAATD